MSRLSFQQHQLPARRILPCFEPIEVGATCQLTSEIIPSIPFNSVDAPTLFFSDKRRNLLPENTVHAQFNIPCTRHIIFYYRLTVKWIGIIIPQNIIIQIDIIFIFNTGNGYLEQPYFSRPCDFSVAIYSKYLPVISSAGKQLFGYRVKQPV